ncbi:MAG TPA: TSUP family transporter [Tepidiformaceae bacterium]|nr:TSUP family transporter [Tepidiformaceae bacterium]
MSRRTMAFVDAVFDGESVLDGVVARRIAQEELASLSPRPNFIPVIVDTPVEALVRLFQPDVLVNASMRKRDVPPVWKGLTPLTIGLGPNFVAGRTTDVVIETSWEDLGRIIRQGSALPLRGEPRSIDGHARDRFVYAPVAGVFATQQQIGGEVLEGEVIGSIGEVDLRAPLTGSLRALTRDGVTVTARAKLAEVDPRLSGTPASGIGERPAVLARSVFEVIADWEGRRVSAPGRETAKRRAAIASAFGLPIGTLGGLIGLGGAEFRLPVLAGPLRLDAHRAVSLNLLVSLATISAALATRSASMSFGAVSDYWPEIAALSVTATSTAFLTAGWLSRLTDARLRLAILILLLSIGCLLLVEGLVGDGNTHLAPDGRIFAVGIAAILGFGIGTISTLLGVAGGELLIPTFVFIFGADVKSAGTASLVVSVPVVLTGVIRHSFAGRYKRREDLLSIAIPMGVASVIGAVVGGMLASSAPSNALKVLLGLILVASAVHMWRARVRHTAVARESGAKGSISS